MKRETYASMMAFWRDRPKAKKILLFVCRVTPYAMMALYGAVMIYLIVAAPIRLIFYISVPASVLLVVSVVRYFLNRPRPFEVLQVEPLANHNTGKSFPSRHTASAFIIAMACLYVNVWLGIAAFFLAVAVGLTRILTGVHYPLDVLAGAGVSILFGSVGFFVAAPQISLAWLLPMMLPS